MTYTQPSVERRALRVGEVATALGISTRKTWRLISAKELATVRIGERGTRILASALEDYISRLQGQTK
jgi:excisionase family DNA binding protein